ncbi:MAG: ADP-ribosylglycohydrolase family protein, partial [Actinomycetota bacterium]|nr:ADP-ribosylglycohydrolase family protein [Actinomycetota bacterium]
MNLTSQQTDRAVGALVGQAAGDALGVHYETGIRADGEPKMLGGGFGGIAPGQWSDDTEMALCIARVAATGADLRTEAALDAAAAGFLEWFQASPPDVGIQTRNVLSRASAPTAEALRLEAAALHAQTGRTGGNGSLMRTSPVALAHLGDPEAIAEAARKASILTHHDLRAGEACVLWCLAIDHAVRTGQLDVRVGLDHVDRDYWAPLLDEAELVQPEHYAHSNGWCVSALLGAWSAISHTDGLVAGLHAAVLGGGDTDTVAAIAGQLLGAAYGASAVPSSYRRVLHGWPGMRVRDLHRLAFLTVNGGKDGPDGWPTAATIPSYAGASTRTVPHPDDPGVLLGAVGSATAGIAEAVVSLCRMGAQVEGVAPQDHVEFWMVDKEDANLDLPGQLLDAARTVKAMREEGKTVLLH